MVVEAKYAPVSGEVKTIWMEYWPSQGGENQIEVYPEASVLIFVAGKV